MHKNLDKIIQLFPDFDEKINSLFQNNEDFRDLCSDYLLCHTMILERKKFLEKNQVEIKEFEELQMSMELEIHKAIVKEKNIF